MYIHSTLYACKYLAEVRRKYRIVTTCPNSVSVPIATCLLLPFRCPSFQPRWDGLHLYSVLATHLTGGQTVDASRNTPLLVFHCSLWVCPCLDGDSVLTSVLVSLNHACTLLVLLILKPICILSVHLFHGIRSTYMSVVC